MKPIRLFLILVIFMLATAGWWLLGVTIGFRTESIGGRASSSVHSLWGPGLEQPHPRAVFHDASGAVELPPAASKVSADLDFKPRQRGFTWHSTYEVTFSGDYEFTNPAQVTQKLRVELPLPGDNVRLENFRFTVSGAETEAQAASAPESGQMSATVEVGPGKTIRLETGYRARGLGQWRYTFPNAARIQNFSLAMHTNFEEIDFPPDTGSPTHDLMETGEGRWTVIWEYPDVIAARAIGMVMPQLLSPGPVAMHIALWAPLSLAVFFLVLIITDLIHKTGLHPMNYLLLAAGFFSFPLLFAYLVDVVNVHASFLIAAGISMGLVCGYLRLAADGRLFKIAWPTQLFYLVLFSYSFFLKGFTGLTLTIGGVVTLGLIMLLTARVNWDEVMDSWRFKKEAGPQPAATEAAV